MRKIVRLLGVSGWCALSTGCAVYGDPPTAQQGPLDGSTGAGGASGATGGEVQDGAVGTLDIQGGGPVGDAQSDASGATPDAAGGSTLDAGPETGCLNPDLCALAASLVHRYSFNGVGTTVTDSVGTAHGTVVNAQLSGSGTIMMAGGTTDQYVDLPNGIIKQLSSVTLEAWVTWSGGSGWQRIFDFGDSQAAENIRTSAGSSLYLTPHGGGPTVIIAAFKRAEQTLAQEKRVYSALALTTGVMVEIAVVIDDTKHMMTLYRDGVFENASAFSESLATLNDINNWLGRSQDADDPAFAGTIHEFRIYAAALSQAAIQASAAAGPDAPLLD
jgi:hypothetical protein